jgi:hypothetical protein
MMILRIGRRQIGEVKDLVDASRRYQVVRDASDEGASTFPEGRVRTTSGSVYRISYNGRVWHRSPGGVESVVQEAA